jgi:hypothetical protein
LKLDTLKAVLNHFTSAKAETQRHTSPTHLLRNKIEKRKNYIHPCRREKGQKKGKEKEKEKEKGKKRIKRREK